MISEVSHHFKILARTKSLIKILPPPPPHSPSLGDERVTLELDGSSLWYTEAANQVFALIT